MSGRPDRLPFAAVRVLKACPELPWGVKAVWIEDWYLDQGPEGSWISAPNLAQRLGMSHHTVEEHRRLLRKVALYFVVERRGAKANGWIPTLPEICIPNGKAVGVLELIKLASRLGEHVHGMLEGRISGLPNPATHGRAEYAKDGRADTAIHSKGGLGGLHPTPTSRVTEVTLPPAVKDGELHSQLGGRRRTEKGPRHISDDLRRFGGEG